MKSLELLIKEVSADCKKALEQAQSLDELEHVRIAYLGRNGKIAELMPQLKELDAEGKKFIGPLMNQCKNDAQMLFERAYKGLENQALHARLATDADFDVTLSLTH